MGLRSRRFLVVFALGFFGLAAQTLLFRRFLGIYEGNELGIGAFFSSWLVWVALGALFARTPFRRLDRMADRFELLCLLYIPVFVLQEQLILHSRQLAGVEPFELFPFTKMFTVSMLANAPVSFMTGFLFTLACRWLSEAANPVPVARVYMFEALGSFVGGVIVTLMLAFGILAESIFLYVCLLLACGVAYYRFALKQYWAPALLIVIIIGFLVSGVDRRMEQKNALDAWTRLLPAEHYQGRFTTAQAQYLYGEYRGQVSVMAWESIAENVPHTEYASEIIAIHLAQKPDAKRVLVVGPGSYSVCRRLLDLPQIEEIVWLHPDREYPARLLSVLPAHLRITSDRFSAPEQDARAFIREQGQRFDLAILNLPENTTLVLNRYFSVEFFHLLKEHLAPGAVVGVRSAGGENFMGGELVRLGASIWYTLKSEFSNIVLKPGDESWFLASDAGGLLQSAEALSERYAEIPGADSIFPAFGLLSVYLEDRAAFQLEEYAQMESELSESQLLNTDRRPRAMLNTLLFVGQQGDRRFALSDFFARLNMRTWWIALAVLALWGFIRLAVNAPSPHPRLFTLDAGILVASTGMVGLSISIVLMLLFQAQYGSIYLYVGLVASLFMLGLFVGSRETERQIRRLEDLPTWVLPAGLLLHILFTLLLLLIPSSLPRVQFALLFFLAGLFGGLYVPVAGYYLEFAHLSERSIGSRIEMCDHLGGAAGGLLTGLILLPVYGTSLTLVFLSAVLALNLFPTLGSLRRCKTPLLLLVILLTATPAMCQEGFGEVWSEKADMRTERLAPDRLYQERETKLADGKSFSYVAWRTEEGREGYVFETRKLVKGVRGFAGPVEMALSIDSEGRLEAFEVIAHRDTPQYFDKAKSWAEGFKGMSIFKSDQLSTVDAVTGATMSSEGIRNTILAAGHRFRTEVLGSGAVEPKPAVEYESGPPPVGKPRDADMRRLRKRIQRGELSDHEARFYQRADD